MEQLLNNFKNSLIADGKSKGTVEHAVLHVRSFIQKVHIEDLSLLTSDLVIKYFADLQGTCSQSKINQVNWAISSFLKYNKITGISLPKQKVPMKKLKKPITEKELSKIIEPQIDNMFPNGLQVKTILYFMFYTGLRKGELPLIKRSHFFLDEKELTINIPKQNKQKKLFITKDMILLLKKYFSTEAEKENAFNTSEDKIDNIFKVLKQNHVLGKDRHIWPHLFRDSFACHCVRKGINLFRIKELMGHSNILTTMGYLTMCQDELKQDFLEKMESK